MATRTRLASAAALLAAVSLVSAPVAASPAPTAGPAPVTAERASTQLEAAPAGIADTSKRIFCERWGLFCG